MGKCEAKCGSGNVEEATSSYTWPLWTDDDQETTDDTANAVDSAGWSGGSATLTSQGFNRDEDLSNIKWVEGVNDWDELDRFRAPSRIHDMEVGSLVRQEENKFRPVQRGGAPPKIDCQVSAWSEWTDCTVSCGIGWTTRKRTVLHNAGNGGRSCPKKMDRKKKCRQMPCPANTKFWYQGNWRHLTYDD